MAYGRNLALLFLLTALLIPLWGYSAEEDEEESDKKSITYTKKAKKSKKSKSGRGSSPGTAGTPAPSSPGPVTYIDPRLLLFPWLSCDYIARSIGDGSLIETCTTEGREMMLEDAEFSSDFYIELGYGIQGASWTPGAARTDDASGSGVAGLLEYKTQGLVLQKSDITLTYLDKTFLTFSDERPLQPSKEQDELMEIRKRDTANGYTKYTFGIQLLPLLEMLEVDNPLANLLFSYRYRVNYETFLGSAKALDDMEYLKKNAAFTSDTTGTYVTSGAVTIARGEYVAFKTLFRDMEHSVDLTQLWGPTLWPLWVGNFESSWERPSDNKRAIAIEGKPVIFDTDFRAKGYFVELAPRFPAGMGFKMALKYKNGTDNRVKNAALKPLGIDFNEDFETLLYHESSAKIWYNFFLTPGLFDYDQLFFGVGYEYNERVWSFEESLTDGSTVTTEADKDVIQKFYMQLRYRF